MIDFIHHFLIGVLACLDGYMNIAMEQTEEYVDGQLKSKYGDCFIRGNNGKIIIAHLPWCCLFLTYVDTILPVSSTNRNSSLSFGQCFISPVRRDSYDVGQLFCFV